MKFMRKRSDTIEAYRITESDFDKPQSSQYHVPGCPDQEVKYDVEARRVEVYSGGEREHGWPGDWIMIAQDGRIGIITDYALLRYWEPAK